MTTVVNEKLVIGETEYRFTSHLAAFEACMRLTNPDWQPHGGGSYFVAGDADTFASIPK